MMWFLVVTIAVVGVYLLTRALRDVRDQVTQAVDSFTEFRAALAPSIVELRDETRQVALRLEPARPAPRTPR